MWQDIGFLQTAADLNSALVQLEKLIEEVPVKFKQLNEEEILRRPAPGKWSKKEILGHLVDSAINNLQRFTEIQFSPSPYLVQSYNQDNLVMVNAYQQIPLEHLLNLWHALNRQIIFVSRMIPKEKLKYPVNPQYNKNEMKDLEWLIGDYVEHMKHHMKQIFPGEISE